MARARLCGRPGCGGPAAATLTFHYAARTLWIDDATDQVEPHSIDLCALHADRLCPPRGWTGQDRRGHTGPSTALAAS
jgi:hypothetical protein